MAERGSLNGKRVLVTGGAGFIGANFVHALLADSPDVHIVVLDALTYAGRRENLEGIAESSLTFVHGDIRDPKAVAEAMQGCNYALNFAAESHVDRSIETPGEFIQTDVYGVFVLCEEARRQNVTRFIQISTDEVYGEVLEGSSDENWPLMPRSPYAASKAGGDRLAYAYWTTYELPVVVTRCSNNYGPRQYPEKLLPLFITNAIDDQPLPVYGTGKNQRDWLHVDDHCSALITLLTHPDIDGETFNIGAGLELDVLTVTDGILGHLDKPKTLIRHVEDRPGHDRRYSVDFSKITRVTGWTPKIGFDDGLGQTVKWFVDNESWWRPIKDGEFKAYYERMYGKAQGAQGGARLRRLLAAVLCAVGMFGAVDVGAQSRGDMAREIRDSRSRLAEVAPEDADEKRSELQSAPLTVVGPVDPDTYVVGPGDVFQLNLSGRVSESAFLTVDPEGQLFIPGVQSLSVAGKTIRTVRAEVLDLIEERLVGVRVDFHLARVRLIRVYLTGDVVSPGAVNLPATSRVSEAVRPDAVVEGASRRNVLVRRRDGTRLYADLVSFDRTGKTHHNPMLQDDDVVNVPAAMEFLEVHGAVARPGVWELGPSDSLHTFLELVGGPLPSALVDSCLLVRWPTATESDSVFFQLDDVYEGRTKIPLRDGDRVYIYFTSLFHEMEQASIRGEVLRPGSYPLETGVTRLSDLVDASGGFLPRADLSAVRVYREDRTPEQDPEFERLTRLSRAEMTDSEYEVFRTRMAARKLDFRVDWRRLQTTPELDILLRDGDIVQVDPLIASVRVEGEVVRPGVVSFDSLRSVNEYIELAGGTTKRAARGKILVTKAVTGQTVPARNVQDVAPGDLIWVPEKRDRDYWLIFRDIMIVAGQIAVIIVALDPKR